MQDTPTSNTAMPRHEFAYHVAILLAAFVVIVAAVALEVRDERVVLPIWHLPLPELCWYKRLTGCVCPGCGLTRSVICIFHGEFSRAWRFNPGGYIFVAVLVYQFPYRILQFLRISRGMPACRTTRATSILVGLLAAFLLIQWFVRMWLWKS